MRYRTTIFAAVLCVTSLAVQAKTVLSWPTKTKQALLATAHILKDNTPQYAMRAPHFMQWFDTGLIKADTLANKTHSEAGYVYTLLFYTHGFNDAHVHIDPTPRERAQIPFRYAGILLRNHRGHYVVYHRDANWNTPPLGAELLSCEGQTVQDLINQDIIPFYFVKGLHASYNRAAHYVFFDGNPFRPYPKQCTFFVNGKKHHYQVNWHTLSNQERQNIAKIIDPQYDFRVEQFGQKGLWISLPTYAPNAELKTLYTSLIHAMPTYRQFNPIVLDVRGNSGGNSMWGRKIVGQLVGQAYLNTLIQQHDHSWQQYRVSPANIARVKKFASAQFVKDMQRALASKHQLYPYQPPPQSMFILSAKPQYQGHVYYLTDAHCISACLDTADLIHWLPNGRIIGQITGADTPYIEVNVLPLPGGAQLQYTMKYWHNRPRKANQPYQPSKVYSGDITNTKAVMRWVQQIRQ